LLGAEDGGDEGVRQGFIFTHDVERRYNIGVIRDDSNKIEINANTYNDSGLRPLDIGVYEIGVEISGNNCGPALYTFLIKYDGGSLVSFPDYP
jgi:hypothetical protein